MSLLPTDRGAELKQLFFESAQEILQSMNEEALRLEKHPRDLEALRSLRRAVHTLKGDAAACGFSELSHLAHEFEDALAGENISQSAAAVETALTAADVFAEMLESYRTGKPVVAAQQLQKMIAKLAAPAAHSPEPKPASSRESPRRATRLPLQKADAKSQASKSKLKKTVKGAARAHRSTTSTSAQQPRPQKPVQPNPAPDWTEYERVAMEAARHRPVPVYQLSLGLDPRCAMLEAALQIVRNILTKAGEILAFAPAQLPQLEASRTIEVVFTSKEPMETLSQKCRIPGIVSEIKIEILSPLGASSPEAAPEAAATSSDLAAGSSEKSRKEKDPEPLAAEESLRAPSPALENLLRVDADRIDNVLILVGELIIGRSMFQQTLLEFGKRFPKDPLRTRFADAFAFQSRVLNDLQRSVMKIRMVPVEQLFRRFPRLVRDTARACDKNVELKLVGQETDLDKGILDSLAEPVAHVVRNAISHGIESAQERQRAGKPEHGTLRLAAYHQGNQVVIEIADDGKGLDAEKIRNKAIARGLVSSDDAHRLTEAELLKMIFLPGFSTAEQITEVSGRGVGLDVVQNVMQRLKGSVSAESDPGHGTTFRLRLPLTLAIIKAILFRVEHRLYAVPLNSVAEMTRVQQSEIHVVDGHEVMQLRKQVLTLVRLGRPAETGNNKLFVLVVSHAGQKLGLVVDELSGQEELVIKALDTSILSSDLISGVSILGDGRVVLILNLAAVAERRGHTQNELSGAHWGMLLPQSEMRHFKELAAAAGGKA